MLFGALSFALLKEKIFISVIETELAFGRGFGARFAVEMRWVDVAAVVDVLFFIAGAIHGEGKQRELSGHGASVLVVRGGGSCEAQLLSGLGLRRATALGLSSLVAAV